MTSHRIAEPNTQYEEGWWRGWRWVGVRGKGEGKQS